MKKDIIKGSTPEEKFKSIDNILRRMNLKLQRTIIGVMPPIPISSYIDIPGSDRIILRYFFVSDGKITKGGIAVEKYNIKTSVKFSVTFNGPKAGRRYIFETRSPLHLELMDMPIEAGDRLIVKVDTVGTDDTHNVVEGVWAGFLFEVDIKSMNKEEFLIDELRRISNGESSE